MKLTYRGVQYQEENQNFSTLRIPEGNNEIIYRGNSTRGRINPRFPWVQYIKQLFYKSGSRQVFDPIAFWYNHKRKFIEDCWFSEDIKQLDRAWNLTLQIDSKTKLKSKQKIQLKYRGVIYYK